MLLAVYSVAPTAAVNKSTVASQGFFYQNSDITIFKCIYKIANTIFVVMSVCPSVRPSAWNNSVPTRGIFMKVDIWKFFENLPRKVKFR
jgi:hypothetical protein